MQILTFKNLIVAIFISLLLIGIIFELIRRRKLNEEYAWIWILAGIVILILSLWTDLLRLITSTIGAVTASSTLFFMGVLFLLLISLHFSVKISALSNKVRKLAQKQALLEESVTIYAQGSRLQKDED